MIKNIYKFIGSMLLCMHSMGLLGQNVNVTGKVTDGATSEAIPGVTVIVKGTTNGAITDIEGNYTISVEEENATLIYSFVGYKSQEQVVNGRSQISIGLELSLTELSEVVVIGYGSQKKKVVTGAIATVSSEEITSTPVLRIESALQGRTPGVQVTQLTGQPGEEPTVRIRGAGTTGNAKPLYVVDGMVVGGIDYLNPGDIESIDVLKDAASAAIYGARAANGVVLITTKSGKSGQMNISYSGYYGVQNVARTVDVLNADQYVMIQNEGYLNAGRNPNDLPFDPNEIQAHDTDWQAALFEKNAPIQNHNISVTGGNENSSFMSSLSYFTQQGIIGGDRSQFDRFTARFNSSHKVNKMLSFGNNFSYSHIIRRGIEGNQNFNGAYSSAINLDPLTPVYETDPDRLSQPPFSTQPVVTTPGGQVYGISQLIQAEIVNPLALIENSYSETRVDKLVGNVYGELEPIEGLKLRTSFGLDLAYVLEDSHIPEYYLNGSQSRNISSVNKEIDRYYTWQWDNTITYTKNIGDHHLTGLAGISAQEYQHEDLFGSNAKVPTFDHDNVYLYMATDTVDQASGRADHSALYSLFGRVTYDFKDKYSFTAILRRDGSSKFGANKRFGIFPSVGVAWVASDEAFLQNLGPVNLLKFRASWGVNGNEAIDNYQYISRINQGRSYIIGQQERVGSSPASVANQDVQWEESEQIDVAVDLGLFENRMTLTADYYIKKTNKLLETVPILAHVGNDPSAANVGSIENKGIELALNWRSQAGDLKYSFNLNGAYNINTVSDIVNEQGFLSGGSWSVAGPVSRAEEGQPIGFFYGRVTDGLFQNQTEVFQYISSEGSVIQPDAQPGDVRFVDLNGDGVITDDDRTFIGNPTPDWTFGFTTNLEYKGFDFSMFLYGSVGNDVFNGIQRKDFQLTNMPASILNRWTGEGTSNREPRYTWDDRNGNYAVSDLYIEDASFVKIKNIQLGYTLPSSLISKMGATLWRFYVSVENLATITKYSGAEPEIGTNPDNSMDIGIDRAVYPQSRTFRLGTTLTF